MGHLNKAGQIFLACVARVPEFANLILEPLGRPIGARSKVHCFTELEFDTSNADRPDGLIGVTTGSSVWKALLEFKVGDSLRKDQVERYLKVSRDAGIDALITVSNDIVPAPEYSPIDVEKRLTRSVGLYHISWMQIYTHAHMLLSNNDIKDSDHVYLIEEFIRFLVHPSTGIKGFTQMPDSWRGFVDDARTIGKFRRTGDVENAVVEAWLQEERELGFKLSKLTGASCFVKRTRAESKDIEVIRKKHLDTLCSDLNLTTEIVVDNAATPILVEADLVARSINLTMRLKAPKDKSLSTASLNWFLRQIPNDASNFMIVTNWPSRAPSMHGYIEDVRRYPKSILLDSLKIMPSSFDIKKTLSLGAKFGSRKGFIESLEKEVESFYKTIGENLIAWTPPPSKSRKQTVAEGIVEKATFGENDDEIISDDLR